MEKILISACLVGDKVRYDGQNNRSPLIEQLLEKYELVPFCPEVEGGLSIPRLPNEIKGKKVYNKKGVDVTHTFINGAEKALNLCSYLNIRIAILKEKSPSCGTHQIYDGSFTSHLINGEGITAKKLKEKGISVYSEDEIPLLLQK